MVKFRTVHGLALKGRPLTGNSAVSNMDEAKGLNLGSQYRSERSSAEFAHYTAQAEKMHIWKINVQS